MPVIFGLDLQITADTLTINGRNGACPGLTEGESIALPEMAVTLADLRQRSDFADFSLYVVGADLPRNILIPPINSYVETQVSKATQVDLARSMRLMFPLHIFVPTMDCDFTECSILAHVHPDLGLTCNLPVQERSIAAPPLIDRTALRLTVPAEVVAGGTARCSLELLDAAGDPLARDCAVYLETTGAYLPKQRVALVAGRADFDAVALGLAAGDAFRIKAGFKHYSGVTDATIAVV